MNKKLFILIFIVTTMLVLTGCIGASDKKEEIATGKVCLTLSHSSSNRSSLVR